MSAKAWLTGSISQPKTALLLLLMICILTHLPSGYGSFIADDYLQWAMLHGSPILHDLGFSGADPDRPLPQRLLNAFHFFDYRSDSLGTYRAYGNVLWWAGDEISMVPLRPLAALTHWMDYTWVGEQLWLHQLHSLLYFLLLTWLLYRLYRERLDPVSPMATSSILAVAWLATLLVLVDFSLTRSFAWIAARNSFMGCAIGVASLLLFIRGRQTQSRLLLTGSMVLYGLALLTAEAALSVAAYMGAYVLCIERQSLWRKVIPLLPVVAIILVWRTLYQLGGFGAHNIGMYVDPGRSPLEFLQNVVTVLPLIAFSQISGIDSLIIFLHPQQQWLLVTLGWLVALWGVWLIWPLLRNNRSDRFWFVGSLAAAIPGTALISAESRTVTFTAIGFFYLLARLLLHWYGRRERWLPRWSFRVVLGWHVVVPLLAAVLMTSGLSGFSQQSSQQRSVADAVKAGETGLVVVNPDSSGMMYYLPFEWAARGFAVPARMAVLGTGIETVDLTRLGEREFLLSAPAGMPLHHRAPVQALDGSKPLLNPIYTGLYTQSFFALQADVPRRGDVVINSDMRITVLEENAVGPTQIRIEFIGAEAPDHKVWQWFDWQTRQYQRLQPLAQGETRRFVGPLDFRRQAAAPPAESGNN